MTRVRFAPSPTGFLHIGSARTFILNWLYARHNGGAMVLRIDDTDVARNTEASVNSIFEGLRWLNLGWDEEYKQSERLAQHRGMAEAIFQKGMAYRDFTLAPSGETKSENQGTWLFNEGMRELSAEESDRRAASGEPFALRFRVPHGRDCQVRFHDGVYGEQTKSLADIEDFALLRSDGMPTYHLASCADDADLRISHIIRGQDHLSNTYKHVLIFEAAGVAPGVRAPAVADGARWRQAFEAPPRSRSLGHYVPRCRLPAAGFHQLHQPAGMVAQGRSRTLDSPGNGGCLQLRGHQSQQCGGQLQGRRPVRSQSRLAQLRPHPHSSGGGTGRVFAAHRARGRLHCGPRQNAEDYAADSGAHETVARRPDGGRLLFRGSPGALRSLRAHSQEGRCRHGGECAATRRRNPRQCGVLARWPGSRAPVLGLVARNQTGPDV